MCLPSTYCLECILAHGGGGGVVEGGGVGGGVGRGVGTGAGVGGGHPYAIYHYRLLLPMATLGAIRSIRDCLDLICRMW